MLSLSSELMTYSLSLRVRHNPEHISNHQSILAIHYKVFIIEQEEVKLTQIFVLEVVIIQDIAN